MKKIITSRRRANAFSSAILFIGLAILSFLNSWWPGLIIVLGLTIALRQFLRGQLYNMCVSIVICTGIFVTYQYHIGAKIILPVIFLTSGIFAFVREILIKEPLPESEEEEDLNLEIEESSDKT